MNEPLLALGILREGRITTEPRTDRQQTLGLFHSGFFQWPWKIQILFKSFNMQKKYDNIFYIYGILLWCTMKVHRWEEKYKVLVFASLSSSGKVTWVPRWGPAEVILTNFTMGVDWPLMPPQGLLIIKYQGTLFTGEVVILLHVGLEHRFGLEDYCSNTFCTLVQVDILLVKVALLLGFKRSSTLSKVTFEWWFWGFWLDGFNLL